MAVTRRSSSRARAVDTDDQQHEEPKRPSTPARKGSTKTQQTTSKSPIKRSKSITKQSTKDDVEVIAPKSPKTTRTPKQQSIVESEQQLTTSPQVKKRTTRSSIITQEEPIKVSTLGADHDGTSRCKSFFQRLWAGLALFSLFSLGIHLGHTVLIPVVFIIQFMMYKELVDLSYTHLLEQKHLQQMPLFSTQNWFWFITASFYSYARVLSIYSNIQIPHYVFITSSLFFIGFVAFVLTLRKDMYRVQFANLAWTFLALLIFILVETAVTVSIMFKGLIWLVLPAILIMTNDTWAYIWGVLFGRTSLIELSAKKTWEGFWGAFISTPIQGWLMTRYMLPHAILICEQTKLFTFEHPTCNVDPLYQLVPYQLGFTIPLLGWDHILIAPMMYHAIWLSIFASVVAPFGGFFASGFKRAYGIKDFGTLIPGHGGFTDRMDCQLIMGIFIYGYYYTFIQPWGFNDCAATCAATCVDYVMNNTNINANVVHDLYQKLDLAGQIAFKKLIK